MVVKVEEVGHEGGGDGAGGMCSSHNLLSAVRSEILEPIFFLNVKNMSLVLKGLTKDCALGTRPFQPNCFMDCRCEPHCKLLPEKLYY